MLLQRKRRNKVTVHGKLFIRRLFSHGFLAIILMMAGALAIMQLPVARVSAIAPPAVSISATYRRGCAGNFGDTVTQVIEQNIDGIDNPQCIYLYQRLCCGSVISP